MHASIAGGEITKKKQTTPEDATTTTAPFSLPEGVRTLPDGTLIMGTLVEVHEPRDGLCVAALDVALYRDMQHIGVPEEHYEELLELLGKRIGLLPLDGEFFVRAVKVKGAP